MAVRRTHNIKQDSGLHMQNFRFTVALAAILCAMPASSQTLSIELKHTSPQEISESLLDLYNDDIKVTVFGTKLVVRAETADLDEIKSLVEQLDVPIRKMILDISDQLPSATNSKRYHSAQTDSFQRLHVVPGERVYLSRRKPNGSRVAVGWIAVTEPEEVDYALWITPRQIGTDVILTVRHIKTTAGHEETLDASISGTVGQWLAIPGDMHSSDRRYQSETSGLYIRVSEQQ